MRIGDLGLGSLSFFAMTSRLALRNDAACAFERPSASASAKFAKSTVNHSPQRDRENEPGRSLGLPREGSEPQYRGQDAAHVDAEHHRVAQLRARCQLPERVCDGRYHDRGIETSIELPSVHGHPAPAPFSGALFGEFTGGLTIVFILSSVSVTAYLPEIIIRCSTTGPSASAGTYVSAPTRTTVPSSSTTKSGPCVGKLPAVVAIRFFAASAPAMARTGMIDPKRPNHIAMPVVML